MLEHPFTNLNTHTYKHTQDLMLKSRNRLLAKGLVSLGANQRTNLSLAERRRDTGPGTVTE